jgi:hypothetical protein
VAGRNILGVGFKPDFVFVKGGDRHPVARSSTLTGDNSHLLANRTELYPNAIQALLADGFQVGSRLDVNQIGTAMHWMAFKNTAGSFKVGTYTGDGMDNRSITGVGFRAKVVWILNTNNPNFNFGEHAWKSASQAGDASDEFGGTALAADKIQAIEPDGFQVGTYDSVNKNLVEYHYMAWK